MKMTKAKKAASIVAVLLAALMVLTIIPAAVFADSNSPAEVFSGQTIDMEYKLDKPTYATETVNIILNGKQSEYNKAKVTETTIAGVYATEINMGSTTTGIVKSTDVSVTPTLSVDADYATSVQAEINKILPQTNQNTNFSSNVKNKLTAVRISSSTSTMKTVYLYAYLTTTTRTFDGNASTTDSPSSSYVYLGSVIIYPTTLTLSVTKPTDVGCNKTGTIIASASSSQVIYELSYETLFGFSSIRESQSGLWQITANSSVTTGNKFTVTAYATNAAGKYILRGSDGKLYALAMDKSTTATQTLDKSTGALATSTTAAADKISAYPVYASQTFTVSTSSPITALAFAQSRYDIEVGDTTYASVSKTPSGATGSVNYSSSNTAVATVSSSGAITGVSAGTATIIATATDGSGVTAYTSVNVTAATVKMSIDASSAALEVGQTQQLKATAVVLANGTTADATYWYSSNANVASVSSTGLVTAKAVGTATINAVYSNGSISKSVSCVVIVSAQSAKIVLGSSSLSIEKGATGQVVAAMSDGSDLIYTSDNSAVVKVDLNGKVTGVSAGVAMITVSSVNNLTVKDYCVVTVTEPKGVIKVSTKKVSNSKYYWTSSISSADVKAAYNEVKSSGKNVTIEVSSKSSSNKVILTRYAIARLAKYANSLTVKCGDRVVVYSNAQLQKMASYGRPVYVYITASSSFVKYKNASGVYKKIF
jgi:uncharacterized protein YjdB